jgi:hypothetical protein
MMKRGEAWLRGQRTKNVSESVLYASGQSVPIACSASRALTRSEALEDGTRIEGRFADWLIDLTELVVEVAGHGIQRLGQNVGHAIANLGPAPSSSTVVPQVGDRITAGGVTYEVTKGPGESHWHWHGGDNLTYRIHTVEVKP